MEVTVTLIWNKFFQEEQGMEVYSSNHPGILGVKIPHYPEKIRRHYSFNGKDFEATFLNIGYDHRHRCEAYDLIDVKQYRKFIFDSDDES